MIESLSNSEIIRLAEDAERGGDYEAARLLLRREMARRGLLLAVEGDTTFGFDALKDEA